MATPKARSWKLLMRIARYLKGKPRLVLHYPWQAEETNISTYSDSDYAGCLRTRRSTSGGCVMIGRHLVKSFSKQQKVIALSSAEAETYALVLASCETLGIQAYAADLGIELSAEMFADASAALGIIARAGLGKVRHLRTQALWLQETRQEGRLKFTKVPGEANPADAGTKYMAAPLLEKHVAAMGAKFQAGRAESAPDLKSIEVE